MPVSFHLLRGECQTCPPVCPDLQLFPAVDSVDEFPVVDDGAGSSAVFGLQSRLGNSRSDGNRIMVRHDDITFNVIFVPETVAYLHVLTRSVIEHSSCRFRLVSNGCLAGEKRLLEQLAAGLPRVEYFELGSEKPLRHGLVLDQLQSMETSGTFAFMDSDIFATGPFLPAMLNKARDAAGIFSCLPIWSTPQSESVGSNAGLVKGFHNCLDDGAVVGSTYFAIYDNNILGSLLKELSVGFEVAVWDDLPRPVRDELEEGDRRFVRYDTGKLINILLGLRNHGLQNVLSDTLHHVGGVSLDVCRADENPGRLSRLISAAPKSLLKFVRSIRRTSRQANGSWRSHVSNAEFEKHARTKQRRLSTSRYLSRVMHALVAGQKVDEPFTHDDPKLAEAVVTMKQQLTQLAWQNAETMESCGSAAA